MSLPKWFCWTRFGSEAGQSVNQILVRKEEERVANGGLFFWGIGNAIGPSVKGLLEWTSYPEVLFSPIRSAPHRKDVLPSAVIAWTSALTLTGDPFRLPRPSLITSKYDPSAPKYAHYALVCYSERPLAITGCKGELRFKHLRNLLTGRPVGPSQVTAVVRLQRKRQHGGPAYPIAIRVRLVYPYFLRLTRPVFLSNAADSAIWPEVVRKAWKQRLVNRKNAKHRRLSTSKAY